MINVVLTLVFRRSKKGSRATTLTNAGCGSVTDFGIELSAHRLGVYDGKEDLGGKEETICQYKEYAGGCVPLRSAKDMFCFDRACVRIRRCALRSVRIPFLLGILEMSAGEHDFLSMLKVAGSLCMSMK